MLAGVENLWMSFSIVVVVGGDVYPARDTKLHQFQQGRKLVRLSLKPLDFSNLVGRITAGR